MKFARRFNCILVTAAAGVLVAAAGCKAPPAAPVQQTAAAAPARPANPDEPSNALPPDILAGLPIYPGAEITHVRKPKGEMREILFAVTAPLKDLIGYYKEQLKNNGFRVSSSLVLSARNTWSCDFARDGRLATLMMYPSDAGQGKMTIDLLYAMPAKVDPTWAERQEIFDVVGPGEVARQDLKSNAKTERN
ncbi:MAG TPA: hypothetical protein VEC38_14070 [Candidatus Binataceae bacterium]|nr:hypothetical protein [Candidatus Binataceae bacterium]